MRTLNAGSKVILLQATPRLFVPTEDPSGKMALNRQRQGGGTGAEWPRGRSREALNPKATPAK